MSPSADPRRAGGRVLLGPPYPQPNFFHFHAVFPELLPNNSFWPQTQGLAPPPPCGKSWIRHWPEYQEFKQSTVLLQKRPICHVLAFVVATYRYFPRRR